MKIRFIVATIFLGFLSSCSAQIGSSIEVPQIALEVAEDGYSSSQDLEVNFSGIIDRREFLMDQANAGEVTQPDGDVAGEIEKALLNGLKTKGVEVSIGSLRTLSGEVIKWRTKVTTKATSLIDSEASLLLEVKDELGKRIYSGTYSGLRSSEFPIVTRVDVKDSLAIAMTKAIEEALNDPRLMEALHP
jgi:hypothetical protein